MLSICRKASAHLARPNKLDQRRAIRSQQRSRMTELLGRTSLNRQIGVGASAGATGRSEAPAALSYRLAPARPVATM